LIYIIYPYTGVLYVGKGYGIYRAVF